MKSVARAGMVLAAVFVMGACGTGAQQTNTLVRSSDPDLAEMASKLLPDLARRSGMVLKEPVRIERRSREQLERYLKVKLDEEMPADEARVRVAAYARFGLVPDTLDLRAMLISLYTEQVAGFYEPDSTALFVMDDQPEAAVQGLLVHELVHAVQDQTVDLHALTDPDLGNDQQEAAQAAIEGHATLVMLEYLTEQMRGAPVDLADIPDFASSLRPTLESMRDQFPALASAPRVVQESLLFPYVEGAGYVQALWRGGTRVAPFGEYLPRSTEQVATHDRTDLPIRIEVEVAGAETVYEDNLGWLETGVLLDTHVGKGGSKLADGWGGDAYDLVRLPGGAEALVWASVWDTAAARDAFLAGLGAHLDGFPGGATLDAAELTGRPGAVLRVGVPESTKVSVRAKS